MPTGKLLLSLQTARSWGCVVCRFIWEKWRAPVNKYLPARKTAMDKNIWGHSHTDCGHTLIFSLAWTIQWRLERIYFQTFSQIAWHVECSTIYLFEGSSICLGLYHHSGFLHCFPSCSLGVTNFALIFRCMWNDILFTSLTRQWKTEVTKFVYTCHRGFVQFLLVIDRNEFFIKYKFRNRNSNAFSTKFSNV
jgi:hypothetical protein